jgi:hypothetical protein
MTELEKMTVSELQTELQRAEAALEDLQEERRFTLGQTGVHIGASRVEMLQQQWAKEENVLTDKIAVIRKLLQTE